MFGDWLLVIAAYNSGPAPVYKAIKKSGSRNFWKLQYFLPKETRMHVKKFIATHYYFEGQGSLVTSGKAETEMFLNSINQNQNEEDLPFPEYKYTDWAVSSTGRKNFPVLIINDLHKIKLIQKK
jgi:membrane-bound lytic murein transglycosylase D